MYTIYAITFTTYFLLFTISCLEIKFLIYKTLKMFTFSWCNQLK